MSSNFMSPVRVVRSWFHRPSPRHRPMRRQLQTECLEQRQLLAVSPTDIVAAFNVGMNDFENQAEQVAQRALGGVDLPMVVESVDTVLAPDGKLQEAFNFDLNQFPGTTLQNIRDQLTAWGFEVQYLGTAVDSSGDLLRAHRRFTWLDEPVQFEVGGTAGFSYFQNGVQGSLEGSLTGRAQPITVDLTVGLDLVNGVPRLYLADSSGLAIAGVSVSGTGQGNIGIKSLLDVNVRGTLSAGLSGRIAFVDADHKVRADEVITNVRGTLNGSLEFNDVAFRATLPLISALQWSGSWKASIANGNVSFDTPQINLPSAGSVLEGIARALVDAKNNTSFLGSVGGVLNAEIPIVNQKVGEILGISQGLDWLVQSTSLATSGIREQLQSLGVTVHLPTDANQAIQFIDRLVHGERVDLVSFEQKGGNQWSDRRDMTLAKIPVYIGSIDVGAYVSAHFGWNFLVGMGVDTMGVYFDPNSNIGVTGGVEAGVKGSFQLGGVLELASVYGALGLRAGLGVELFDPDPSDGRLYLDEIFRDENSDGRDDWNGESLGQRILSTFDFYASGEAYGRIGAKVNLPWPLPDITLFDESFSVGTFWNTNDQHTMTAQQSRRLRGVSVDQVLSLPKLADGTLLITGDSLSDRVILSNGANGVVDVNWLGRGKGTFTGITRVRFDGNDGNDRLEVSEGFGIRIEAYGRAGNDVLQGSGVADLLDGGDGDDRIDGRAGNDVLQGQNGRDLVKGGGGDDTLRGHAGDDTLDGGDGTDLAYGGTEDDYILGGRDNDRLYGEQGNDVIRGGDANDTIDGGVGRDQLSGENGDDVLSGGAETDIAEAANDMLLGGAGNDTLRGGVGSDILDGEAGIDTLYGDAGNDALVGGDGNDTLDGGDGNDHLNGEAGNDSLLGQAGNDVLLGGAGTDTVRGGAGDDRLNGGADADTVYGDAGDDVLELDFHANNAGAVDVLRGGIGRDTVAVVGASQAAFNPEKQRIEISDDFADVISIVQTTATAFRAEQRDINSNTLLNSFSFSLVAGTSSDVETVGIYGQGGNDVLSAEMLPPTTSTGIPRSIILDGGDGDDLLVGSLGNDLLRGGTGVDRLFGGQGNDELRGGAGNDTIDGGEGNDRLYGEDDDDSLDGNFGRDIQYGGNGNDVLRAGSGLLGDLLYGGDGNDELFGGDGIDMIQGQADKDTIYGGGMADILWGGDGDDLIRGDAGIDMLSGGGGNDELHATDGLPEAAPSASLQVILPEAAQTLGFSGVARGMPVCPARAP